MNHWIVFHSQKTMGHNYESLCEAAVYSTKKQPKLCFLDVIWVIEGSTTQPMEFSLVDCFLFAKADYPPFTTTYARFELKVGGDRQLLEKPVILDKALEWFKDVHSRYLTKRGFFVRIGDDAIIDGLKMTSGINV